MLPPALEKAPRVFRGKRFDVCTFETPGAGGKPLRRDVVIHPGAAVILPLLNAQTVLLLRNQRPAVGQTLWELPAGTLEPGEAPEVCAARELVEETGYRAKTLRKLTDFYSSPGICTERMYAYVAEDLEPAAQHLDEGEEITVQPVQWGEALRMIRDNEIRDGKSIAALLYYHTWGYPGSAAGSGSGGRPGTVQGADSGRRA